MNHMYLMICSLLADWLASLTCATGQREKANARTLKWLAAVCNVPMEIHANVHSGWQYGESLHDSEKLFKGLEQ